MNTLIWGDKNPDEIIPYTVQFLDRLLVGETIVTPEVTILVFSGDDPAPSDMVVLGSVTLNTAANAINFVLTGGVPGAVYVVVVSAIISSGNLYMKVGRLAIVASDPFATAL